MDITKKSIIGELVAHDFRAASVFKKNKIDFCCNGNRTIDEACTKKGLDADKLVKDLHDVSSAKSDSQIDYTSWPLDLLADYIEKKHHRYVKEKIQEITPFLNKIVRVHGERHPELLKVEELFSQSVVDFTEHMDKEENILFPHIRKMVENKNSNSPVQASFGTVQNPIKMMMEDHDNEGERYRQIADLTNNYTVPEDGCTTYRVTFAMLNEFEEDLQMHIHLENNILFPKSVELEEQFVNV